MVLTFPRLKVSSRLIAAILLVCLSLLPVLRFAPIKASARKLERFKRSATTPAPQTTPAPGHRKGEVLVRFRTGVSENDKDVVAATHKALRKQLCGESA